MSWDENIDLADYSLSVPDSPMSSPAPTDVVSTSWLPSLDTAIAAVSGIAKGAAFIIGAKDQAASMLQQRSIDQATTASNNNLAMAKLGFDSQIAQLGFQTQLAKAQAALKSVTGGSGISLGVLALGAVAVYFIAKHH
jgi:hypothetical protein